MKRASLLVSIAVAVVIAQGCRTSAPGAVADQAFLGDSSNSAGIAIAATAAPS